MNDLQWFKDAVIYEVHIKSFFDSNGDGIGDIRGLIEKIDYFTELGVTAVWLLPFYPSPLRDDGYDIADYCSVNPSYGTMEDFREFLDAAHQRGLKVITELVINHTSDQHPWFQRARRAAPGTKERDFYVWSETTNRYTEARIIFKDFEPSNWSWDAVANAYYWHRFFSHQPDLNFDSPAVHDAVLGALDFWMEMGVDGLRLDAIPYLYERDGTNCENLPETHAFLKKLRRHVDEKFGGRMLLAEANQWPEDAAAYFGNGDECHMNFHFPIMPRLFMSLQMEDRFPIIDILDQTPAIPPGCQWATFLRNHDELTLEMVTDEERDYMYRVYADDPRARINLGIRRRLAPLLANNRRRIELINALLFSLPGTPIVYYGDEIGMGDNFYLGDRNGVRTPMQWAPDRNGGFSKANPQRLYLPAIIDPEYHYEAVNVENQRSNGSSLFWWMRRLIAERKRWKAFGHGKIEFLQPQNARVLAFIREYGDETVLVVANLSRFTQAAELDLSAYAGLVPMEIFSRSKFPEIRAGGTMYTLGPHNFYWIALRRKGKANLTEGSTSIPLLDREIQWSGPLTLEMRELLERELLPNYLEGCRWFARHKRNLRELRITDDITIQPGDNAARILFLHAAFTEGLPETYILPLQCSSGELANRILTETPRAAIARFGGGAQEQILHDAVYDGSFRTALLEAFVAPPTARGRLQPRAGATLDAAEIHKLAANSQILDCSNSNSTITYGGVYFFKLYRRLEWGRQPEEELTRYLTQTRQFPHTPPYAGSLQHTSMSGGPVATVGLLLGFVQNQGDGWSYIIEALGRYFERVIAAKPDIHNAESVANMVGAMQPERIRQLGQHLGELHVALASSVNELQFTPEPFTTLYQRSLYQAVRGQLRRSVRLLAQARADLPESLCQTADTIIRNEAMLLERFSGLLKRRLSGAKIAIHGSYHLGQVLNTGKDFVIADLEGDPSKPLSERSLKRSPLRDVASMQRSFDYAARNALSRQQSDDHEFLEPWAEIWTKNATELFQTAYQEATQGAAFLPASKEDFQLLLDVFVLDRAAAEIDNELVFRPDMAAIPLHALCHLVERNIAG